jgi:hypothetical protein
MKRRREPIPEMPLNSGSEKPWLTLGGMPASLLGVLHQFKFKELEHRVIPAHWQLINFFHACGRDHLMAF